MGFVRSSSLWKPRGALVLLVLAFILAAAFAEAPAARAAAPEAYKWDNVSIGGGGFVIGMAIHPTEPDLVYIRTDVGGAYRWYPAGQRWIQLMNSFPQEEANLYGIDSVALDPSNPDLVYLAAGKYPWSPSDILKSTDRGATWAKSSFTPLMKANGEARDMGERLAVDPNDGNILYMATRFDGLWRSTAASSPGSWKRVEAFPTVGTSPIGLDLVVFDKRTGTKGSPTQTIYVGVRDSGMYRSTDGGASWGLMNGSPTQPNRAVTASDGTLYVSHSQGVAKFKDGVWTNITPPKAAGYNGITVDPTNPAVVMASAPDWSKYPNAIYRSVDGGATWTPLSYNKHPDVPWWTGNWFAANVSSLTIDPVKPKRVWFTDFFGTWSTDDITATPSQWYTHEKGHEEVVTFALRSTPIGAKLFSGHADVDGMRHASLDTFPAVNFSNPDLGDTVSIDFQESNPNFVARVGTTRYNYTGGGSYSTDNGVNWQAFSQPPGIGGRIAVSAGSETIVWLPQYGSPQYSTDRGQSWIAGTGAPTGLVNDFWTWHQPLASDRVNSDTFYLMDRYSASFYRSTDGGATWSVASTLPVSTGSQPFYSVKAAPGMAGEVWVGMESGGLFRSSDSGGKWAKLSNVQQAKLFAFGKNKLGKSNPTVFVYGIVDNVKGIFRSDDMGATWVKIDLPNPTAGNEPNTMEGDRQVWGRVYIGTNGTGVFYGDTLMSEEPDTAAPSVPGNLTSSSVTATAATLSWTPSTDNTGVAGYEIYKGGTLAGTTVSPTNTTYTVKGLTPGTSYTFTVRAKDGAGNVSADSLPLVIKTAPSVAPPTNLTVSSADRTSISLSWSPPANPDRVTGYNIYSGTKLVGSAAGTSFTLTGLLPDRAYSISVRSKDAADSTSAPATVTVTTSTAPGTLAFSDDFQDGKAEGWTPKGGNWWVSSTNGTAHYTQSDYFNSNSFSTIDDSSYGNYIVESKVRLNWSDVDLGAGLVARYQDPNNYYVFYNRAGKLEITRILNGKYTVLASRNYTMSVGEYYTFTAVLNNGALEFYVDGIKELSAIDATPLPPGKAGLFTLKIGVDFDNVKVIRDRDFTPPAAPTGVKAASVTENSVELAWNPATDNIGVVKYEVYSGPALLGTVTSSTYAYTVTGLTPGTAYTYSVKAVDAVGNVSPSSPLLEVTTTSYLVEAKKTMSPITVDGALNETVWSMAKQIKKTAVGTSDNTATFGVLWDQQYLYVGVKVLDGSLANDSSYPGDDDSVEIYIDGNHNRGTVYDGSDRLYIKGWYDPTLFEKKWRLDGVLHGGASIQGGYSVELAIPWSTFGIVPTAGMTVGFDVGVNDDEFGMGPQGRLVWAGTANNGSDTSGFGSLVLSQAVTGDTQAPTAPAGLTSPSHTDKSVNLVWTASTDNVGVTQYEIYNGETLAGTSDTASYQVTGLKPGKAYTFTVKSKDGAGNVSASSNPVQVTTDASYVLLPTAKTTAVLTVDGKLDEAEWTMAKQVGKTISGTANNSAEFGVLWDDQYLYVGAKVTDAELFNNSNEPYLDDSVEVYLDGNHNQGSVYDSFDRQFIKGWNDSDLFESRGLKSGVLHAWSAIPGGYSIELAIPWVSLGLTPAEGMLIGFDVAVNDEDTGNGRDSQIMWAGTGDNWSNTSSFGELLLSGSKQSADTVAPTAPANLTSLSKAMTSVDLTWHPSTDNMGVTGYDVYNGSILAGTVTSVTYSVYGLLPNTAYEFRVAAKDAAGNVSPLSDPLHVTTLGAASAVMLVGDAQALPGRAFHVDLGLSNVTGSVYASQFTVQYDPALVEFVSAEALKEGVGIWRTSTDVPGTVKLVAASEGPDQAVTAAGSLFRLNWKVHSGTAHGTAIFTVSKAILAGGTGQEQQADTNAEHRVTIVFTNRAELLTLIGQAQVLHDATQEGEAIGRVPAGAKTALAQAIVAAQAVAADEWAAQSTVDAAVAALGAAVQSFRDAIITTIAGDMNEDGVVSIGDLAMVVACFGKTTANSDWDAAKKADFDHDGSIGIPDLVFVASRISLK
ncbi:sugar-binding protein [Gorillibacterium sp. sgz5001074]|uniref:sugar-binding protein n=1 Tax=Gorillibacterium sp. sgz5001074 TaxID=3446695 RepID=UPI003F6703DD